MNNQRTFDNLQQEKLGKYVYVLRDPRDRKVFYVGQGTNNRVFDHFGEADSCLNSDKPFNQLNSKVVRILDIWKNNEDVEWIIISHNLPIENKVADYIESAIYDSLSESQNGETSNGVCPPESSRLLPDDIVAMAADYVNPDVAYKKVFVFSIQNALFKGVSPYDATRMSWIVSNNHRSTNDSYAVGLKNSISKASYKILSWTQVIGTNRYEFTSPDHPFPATIDCFINKNWNNILAVAKGYWQRGNFLIVEFDGAGKFRIDSGSQDKITWHNCI